MSPQFPTSFTARKNLKEGSMMVIGHLLEFDPQIHSFNPNFNSTKLQRNTNDSLANKRHLQALIQPQKMKPKLSE